MLLHEGSAAPGVAAARPIFAGFQGAPFTDAPPSVDPDSALGTPQADPAAQQPSPFAPTALPPHAQQAPQSSAGTADRGSQAPLAPLPLKPPLPADGPTGTGSGRSSRTPSSAAPRTLTRGALEQLDSGAVASGLAKLSWAMDPRGFSRDLAESATVDEDGASSGVGPKLSRRDVMSLATWHEAVTVLFADSECRKRERARGEGRARLLLQAVCCPEDKLTGDPCGSPCAAQSRASPR